MRNTNRLPQNEVIVETKENGHLDKHAFSHTLMKSLHIGSISKKDDQVNFVPM